MRQRAKARPVSAQTKRMYSVPGARKEIFTWQLSGTAGAISSKQEPDRDEQGWADESSGSSSNLQA